MSTRENKMPESITIKYCPYCGTALDYEGIAAHYVCPSCHRYFPLSEESGAGKLSQEIAIGVSDNKTVRVDFMQLSHLLIGGTTGSGKTSLVQAIIAQLMQLYTPEEIKIILCVSKVSDYGYLIGSPFLQINVISGHTKVTGVLNWLLSEINRRQQLYQQIKEQPHLFVFLDDYSDLAISDEAKQCMYELVRLGRSVHIHCILITSTPTKRNIPPETSANIPYRIAFSSTSKALSELTIGMKGAEHLVPREMIYVGGRSSFKCESAYVDMDDLQRISNDTLEKWNPPHFTSDEHIEKKDNKSFPIIETYESNGVEDNERDVYFEEAGRYIIEKDKASIGMIQRRFKIGFNRAVRIMNQLYEAGVVDEEKGIKPRAILMTMEEFDSLY